MTYIQAAITQCRRFVGFSIPRRLASRRATSPRLRTWGALRGSVVRAQPAAIPSRARQVAHARSYIAVSTLACSVCWPLPRRASRLRNFSKAWRLQMGYVLLARCALSGPSGISVCASPCLPRGGLAPFCKKCGIWCVLNCDSNLRPKFFQVLPSSRRALFRLPPFHQGELLFCYLCCRKPEPARCFLAKLSLIAPVSSVGFIPSIRTLLNILARFSIYSADTPLWGMPPARWTDAAMYDRPCHVRPSQLPDRPSPAYPATSVLVQPLTPLRLEDDRHKFDAASYVVSELFRYDRWLSRPVLPRSLFISLSLAPQAISIFGNTSTGEDRAWGRGRSRSPVRLGLSYSDAAEAFLPRPVTCSRMGGPGSRGSRAAFGTRRWVEQSASR